MPARLRKLKKAAKKFGVELVCGSGRHPWYFDRDGKVYPVKAHNGEKSEIPDVYIDGLCRCYDIDRDELKGHLSGPKIEKSPGPHRNAALGQPRQEGSRVSQSDNATSADCAARAA